MEHRSKAFRPLLFPLLLCLTISVSLFAQQKGPMKPPAAPKPKPPANEFPHPLVRHVNMVLVPVTVLDPYGRLVTGLQRDNFRIYQNGVQQEITHFSEDDVPISIGVIFDVSGSMTDKIQKAKMAALQFLKTANPQDEFFLVDISSRAELISPFTSEISILRRRLMSMHAGGMTALYDAVYLGLSEMRGAHNSRKALLIISDGGDNHSRYSEHDIRQYLKESDVQIYAIGIYEPLADRTGLGVAEGPAVLRELADMSGGRVFPVTSLSELPDIATKISMELRNQYVLGYRPSDPKNNGKWRKIKVSLRPPPGLPPLTLYYKHGYYAPKP